MSVTIELNGLVDLQRYLDQYPDVTRECARMAINQTAERKVLPLARERIATQANFSKEYLKDPKRLGITKHASEHDLEAVITARHRPTSLARFTTAKFPTRPGEEIQVKVKPGQVKTLKRAFIVKLRAGRNSDAPTDNRGLAVRLAEGKKPRESEGYVELAPNVYLFYGPSVNQIFNTVREDIMTPVAEYLADEFLRQWARKIKD